MQRSTRTALLGLATTLAPLLVEGLDGSGATVSKTTWVRDVPPNNRAFFKLAVPTAAAYRVSIRSFDWVEDQLDRRKAW